MSSFFLKRKEKILLEILNNSIVILFSGSSDKYGEAICSFFVNRNFYYLTNISQENSWLVILKNKNGNIKEYLFIEQKNINEEKWFGCKLSKKKASKLSNIKNVVYYEDINKYLDFFIKKDDINNIYIDFSADDKEISTLKEKYKNIIDICSLIYKLRMQKDFEEIKNIKKAIKITNIGIKKIAKKILNVKKEFEICNAFNEIILNNGTREIAFPSIIASGVNACCLHYSECDKNIKKNELILCDVGAAYKHYACDITRVLPVNGCFSSYQRKIYEIVLNCNKKIIKSIYPEIYLFDLQRIAKDFLTEQCLLHGIIKKSKDIEKYYYHNVSHHLGLNVHDVFLKNVKLQPGMVITVEPGLYIKEKKIGIRIEDDVLVTKNGSFCLTSMIPKEIKDIENLFIKK